MSQLRSALEEMTGVSDEGLSVGQLAEDITELSHIGQMVEVLRARKIRHLTHRDGLEELGYSSATNLLCDLARMTPGNARRVISFANTAERAPIAHQAWVDGRLSTDQARSLFTAAEALPDLYPEAEESLVDIVELLDPVDTNKAVTYWRHTVELGDPDPNAQWARRCLSISATTGGMRRVDGWLTPLAGEALEVALDALTPPRRDGDDRTPRQRRHDALEDLARDWLDNGTTPTVGGEKPHIVLHADLDALQGIAGGLHETDTGEILDVDALRMIACDCSLTRVVLGPDSQVLDVGRKTRVWAHAQRRAIVARDRHCQGPGCRARPQHCDIHHIASWKDDGETNVENGVLLCRRCHRLEHSGSREHPPRT